MQHNVIITGANRGIGFEAARKFGKKGFRVWLGVRHLQSGLEATQKLAGEGVDAECLLMDVQNRETIQKAFVQFSSRHDRLDVLVNNAGILLDEAVDILSVPANDIQATIGTNSLGPLYVCQVFAPLLKKGSRVINVSSGAGEICRGMSTYAPVYSISKTALNAITCQLAHAFKRSGVAINAVCPGWVRTDMGGRMAPRSPAKGVETILWLATEAPISETGRFWRDMKPISW